MPMLQPKLLCIHHWPMAIDNIELSALCDIIVTAARAEIVPRFHHVSRAYKRDGSVITEADVAMQQRVAMALKRLAPGVAFLGEEMTAAEQGALLAAKTPIWCLDPLDGTRNFASGIPYFSVSVALLTDGQVDMAVVYDPLRDECFSARRGQGAWLNGERLQLAGIEPDIAQAIAIVDFKRLDPALATRLATAAPYSSQRSFGSVALDWCWLAAGRGELYLHGRSNIWDYAGGHLVFTEAGGLACGLDRAPVFDWSLVPRSCVGAVSAELFADWTQWLGV